MKSMGGVPALPASRAAVFRDVTYPVDGDPRWRLASRITSGVSRRSWGCSDDTPRLRARAPVGQLHNPSRYTLEESVTHGALT